VNEFIGSLRRDGGWVLSSDPVAPAFGPLRILHRGFVTNPGCAGGAESSGGAVFAAAYQRWGARLSRHLLGEYALAVYDASDHSLVLAHDELGLMPLYYAAGGDGVMFGSHLDDLVRTTGVGELDEEYVADHFARGEHFGERTPYRHIRRLLPGRNLTWKDGKAAATDTWTLGDLAPLRYRDEREYDEHFRSLLTEAVNVSTPATGKVWCELSGGLDSSTLLALACRHNAAAEAVSFVFPKSYMSDEREWIEAVLAQYPVPWHPIDNDAVRPFTELPARAHAEPNEWIARAGLERVYTELLDRHGVDVVLSGEGGDAVLLGDEQFPFFFADLLLHGRLRELWCNVGDWTAGKRSRTFGLLAYAVRPALRYLRAVPLEYVPAPIAWASADFARRANLKARGRATWLPPAASVGAAYALQRMLLAMHIIAVQHHHRHVAAEFRHPLLHRPLVEFMLRVPPQVKFVPHEDRVIQRRALAGTLPEKTLQRRDKGGSCQPHIDGLESSPAWYHALTGDPQIVRRGYADLGAWRQTVQLARFGRMPGLKYFQASATLEIWLQQLENLSALPVRADRAPLGKEPIKTAT
jgi:asparagine synthase (glutamine-hydrolysing)